MHTTTVSKNYAVPAGIYLHIVNNGKPRALYEICSKLTIKTPEQRHWHRSGVFILNFEYFTHCSGVSIVDFEQVNVGWIFLVLADWCLECLSVCGLWTLLNNASWTYDGVCNSDLIVLCTSLRGTVIKPVFSSDSLCQKIFFFVFTYKKTALKLECVRIVMINFFFILYNIFKAPEHYTTYNVFG